MLNMLNIDFESLRQIGLTQAIINQLATLNVAAPDSRLVRVTEVQRDGAIVHDGAKQFRARALARDDGLAVGDWVLVDQGAGGNWWLGQRLAPFTHLARRSADGQRQPLASNIDTALLVMGLDHDFNLRRIERYLALVHAAGVAPVVLLTKADIAPDAGPRLAQLRERLPGSVPAFAVNGLDPATLAVLAPWMGSGQTLILLGSSGAGKSTLTNAFSGGAQATGAVRNDDSRGRHTTTARSLHVCAGGACIIDTPGLRSLQPDIDEAALNAAFEDIDALAWQCQFRDCRHEAEPGCAVRPVLDLDRLRNYHKLLREARRGQQTQRDRIAERAKFKVLMKAAGARSRAKKAGLG
jgi:ribosome biogenesis GTPase